MQILYTNNHVNLWPKCFTSAAGELNLNETLVA